MFRFVLVLIGFPMGMSSVMALEIVSVENQQYRHVLTSPAKKVQFPLSSEDKNLIKLVTPQVRHPERVFLREGSPCSGRDF